MDRYDPIKPPSLKALGVDLCDLTSEQRAALDKMRQEFGNVKYAERDVLDATFALNDYTYIKYLRARNWDFNKAKEILHKTVTWRNRLVPAAIQESQPGLHITSQIIGKSREGHPVLLIDIDDFSPNDYTLETYVQSRVFELEQLFREMARDGWLVDKYVLLFEVRAFKFMRHVTPHALRLYQAFSEVLQNLYRDSIHMILIPGAFSGIQRLFKLCKPLLRPETAKRIMMLKTYDELSEFIEPSELYEHLGGTKPRERFYSCEDPITVEAQ